MDNVRTKRAKKPNPKYSDSDYETIAALRRPSKQAKLERRSSHLSEKEAPSHDGTLNSTSSVSDYEDSIANELKTLLSEEDIKVEIDVGDTEDNPIPISNGQISPVLIDTSPIKTEEPLSVAPDTSTTSDEVPPVLLNVNGTSKIEKMPNTDIMSSILRNQANLNKRLDKIEVQITKILEILHTKQESSPKGQPKINKTIQKFKDPGVKNILKKKSTK